MQEDGGIREIKNGPEVDGMKIAINLFPIANIGGILTTQKNLKIGLEKLGHEVKEFYITTNKNILPAKDCKVLGFEKSEWLNEYKQVMGEFDVVIFTHPCPTLNKNYNRKNWQECYKINSKIISIFHDPYWNTNYPWIKDVFNKITKIACIQQKSFNTLGYFLPVKKQIINHPLNLDDMGKYNDLKENLVISPHQFKTWKHIDIFIRAIPFMKNFIKKEVYNDGIIKSFMSGKQRQDEYKDANNNWIWEEALKYGMIDKGVVNDEEIKRAFIRQKCTISLSTGELGSKIGGNYRSMDYSILECMKYGGIPICRFYSVLSPIFQDDNFVLLDEKDLIGSTAEKINHVIQNFDKFINVIDTNFEILKNNYDSTIVAKKILEDI